MLTFFLVMLFIFWTMFGSFASVIIYRIKSGEGWIINWRSHCKTCDRNLSALELIPIFSWLFQWGKCKWCKKSIASIYPILELTMWILFACVWYFMIDIWSILDWNNFEIFRLFFFLAIIFLTVIYVFYDILYLEIPESILAILNIWVLGALMFELCFAVFFDLRMSIFPWMEFVNWASLYWLQILIAFITLWWLYIIMTWWLKEVYDVLIVIALWMILIWSNYFIFSDSMLIWFESPLMSWLLAAMALFTFFFLQILVSGWEWMWAWDLRIAIVSWLIVWIYLTLPAWMITYVSGSIIWIVLVVFSKAKHGLKNKFQHQIPFWPFIAAWYVSIMFFHSQISSFIALYF